MRQNELDFPVATVADYVMCLLGFALVIVAVEGDGDNDKLHVCNLL